MSLNFDKSPRRVGKLFCQFARVMSMAKCSGYVVVCVLVSQDCASVSSASSL